MEIYYHLPADLLLLVIFKLAQLSHHLPNGGGYRRGWQHSRDHIPWSPAVREITNAKRKPRAKKGREQSRKDRPNEDSDPDTEYSSHTESGTPSHTSEISERHHHYPLDHPQEDNEDFTKQSTGDEIDIALRPNEGAEDVARRLLAEWTTLGDEEKETEGS